MRKVSYSKAPYDVGPVLEGRIVQEDCVKSCETWGWTYQNTYQCPLFFFIHFRSSDLLVLMKYLEQILHKCFSPSSCSQLDPRQQAKLLGDGQKDQAWGQDLSAVSGPGGEGTVQRGLLGVHLQAEARRRQLMLPLSSLTGGDKSW